MTIAEFGAQFMDLVVTTDLVAKQLSASVPATTKIDVATPIHIWGEARTAVGATTIAGTADPERERRFDTPLKMTMTLYIDEKVGQENYEISAKLNIQVVIRPVQPLKLQVTVVDVKPADIVLTSTGKGNWFDLAKRFFGLDDKVKENICSMIKQATAKDLSTDLLELVKKANDPASSNGGPTTPSSDLSSKGMTVLKRGADPTASTLQPDELMRAALADAEDTDVVVYARKISKAAADGEVDIRIIDRHGGALHGWGLAVFAAGENWDRVSEPVSSLLLDGVGQAMVQITNIRSDNGESPAIEVKVQVS